MTDVLCVHTYRFANRDWAQGQVYSLSAEEAETLVRRARVQIGMHIVPILRFVTDEDRAAMVAPPPPVAGPQPEVSALEAMKLESLRALGAEKGIPGAEDLGQRELIAALAVASAQPEKADNSPNATDTSAASTSGEVTSDE